jgi:hypothetical protein
VFHGLGESPFLAEITTEISTMEQQRLCPLPRDFCGARSLEWGADQILNQAFQREYDNLRKATKQKVMLNE